MISVGIIKPETDSAILKDVMYFYHNLTRYVLL